MGKRPAARQASPMWVETSNLPTTGFDQPLLQTMYVVKRLAGVQAVQTLSRLNRIAPFAGAQNSARNGYPPRNASAPGRMSGAWARDERSWPPPSHSPSNAIEAQGANAMGLPRRRWPGPDGSVPPELGRCWRSFGVGPLEHVGGISRQRGSSAMHAGLESQ